ncbi:MAG: lyase family protein [Roseobacter sp.]
MAASVFDSPLYARLFPTSETGRLFSDSAAIRAMLLVEGTLARVQGQQGIIPQISAAAIHRASLEILIDPGALAEATGQNGVCVPGLVNAFRTEMNAPEHAQFVHWGATSQDIIDTGLMLRLRQALALSEKDLRTVLIALAQMARAHAQTPMAARTYAQEATPTTWGAVIAQWGSPLLDQFEALPLLRAQSLWVSLSGASGTSSALGEKAPALRAALAKELGLGDPGRSWHTNRGPVLRITDWCIGILTTLGAMGRSLTALSASGVAEVRFDTPGGSSTMPQKQNPVAPEALIALAQQAQGLRSALGDAAMHQHQRDGAAWFTEWMVVPQIVLATASALQIAGKLAETVTPDSERMRATLVDGLGLAHAEALSFALCAEMPRPKAQDAVKALVRQASADNTPLWQLARDAYPDVPAKTFDALAQCGQAPAEAQDFALRVEAL